MGAAKPSPVTPLIIMSALSKVELGDPINLTPATLPTKEELTSTDFANVKFSPFTS